MIAIQLPIMLAGGGFILLALVLLPTMPETRFRPNHQTDRSTFRHIMHTATVGITIARNRPVVRVLLVVALLMGLSSEAFDRLWAKHLIDNIGFPDLPGDNDNVLWFGIIALTGTLISLGATEIFGRLRPEWLGPGTPTRLLAVLAGGRVMATIGFAVAGNLPIALAMFWSREVLGDVFQPVRQAWLQRNLESSTRATVISVEEQIASIGEIGGGPPLGIVGSRFGIRQALVATGVLFAPAIAVLLRASHLRDHAMQDGVEQPDT